MFRLAGCAALVVLIAALVLAPGAGATTTFTVDSTGDGPDASTVNPACDDGTGHCTLRAAIQQANATSGTDTIAFGISGSGVHTIAPDSALPIITGTLTINGYSEPGSTANTSATTDNAVPAIELQPGNILAAVNGLTAQAAVTIRGLVIHGFGGAQIRLNTAGASTIAGNFIGTDATGLNDATPTVSTTSPGVEFFDAPGNVVGGTAPADRNVIAGNNGTGVFVSGPSATGNTVLGNLIGINRTGTARIGNRGPGIQVDGGSGTTIGGTDTASRNVISGNTGTGVTLGAGSNDTHDGVVEGNFIGVSPDGGTALPNNLDGVLIGSNAHDNTVGGIATGVRNVISGNSGAGVDIVGASATGNLVAGNFIGTKPGGTSALGNQRGIDVVAAPSNTIGGTVIAARNVVSGNGIEGIRSSGDGLIIVGNFIGTTSSGSAALPNGFDGVSITGASDRVGGSTSPERNVISGNAGNGVHISGTAASGDLVAGNRIGTNSGGTGVVSNDGDGLRVDAGAAGATIGGTVPSSSPGAPPGNLVSGNGGSGITVKAATGTQINGNAIGTDAAGTTALPNNDDGVTIRDGATSTSLGPGGLNLISGNGLSGVFIGGGDTSGTSITTAFVGTTVTSNGALGNDNGIEIASGAHDNTIGSSVIAGNTHEGVLLDGSGTTENVVQSNRIGQNQQTTAAVPNGQGVVISGGAQLNTIGGTAAKTTNVIGGNTAEGVLVTGAGTNRNVIRGDFIGINSSGLAAMPNGSGVNIEAGARANTVGGSSLSSTGMTLISGNTNAGVRIAGAGTRSNRVQASVIGVDKNLAAARPNNPGVLVTSGATDTTIGGSSAALGNVIARNAHSGVEVSGDATTGTDIARNRTFLNGGLGINLRPTGEAADTVTPNDGGDGDSGPNALQNFPVLTSATASASETTVGGTLNSTPNTQFRIDLFSNPVGTSGNAAEGETYLGSATVTTDGSGNATFAFLEGGDLTGEVFKATATNTSTRNTSELSAARTAT